MTSTAGSWRIAITFTAALRRIYSGAEQKKVKYSESTSSVVTISSVNRLRSRERRPWNPSRRSSRTCRQKPPSLVSLGQTVDIMVMLAGAVAGKLLQNLWRHIAHVLADDF